jgi:hypothetical protein
MTITVPAVVPSLFHNSRPDPAVVAPKNSTPFDNTSSSAPVIKPSPAPGLMSLTITVPALVPSVFHSS